MSIANGPSDQTDIEIDLDSLQRKYAQEREKRLRVVQADTGADPTLTGKFSSFGRDPYADPGFTRDPVKEQVDVLVVGGGMGGLLTSARLREKGIASIRIVEKGADFGGTWYWNRYPGAACDVESYIYLPMLEETRYMPLDRYSKSTEIRTYLQSLAKRFDLYPAALFQTLITELNWNDSRERWIAVSNRGDEIAARFVVSCTGALSNPKLPKIPGIETFEGHTFHTSRWDYAYTGGSPDTPLAGLNGRTVGIIGTGATAIQVIPHVAESAKHLYVFQRTPSSVDERGNRSTDPDWFKTISATTGWQRARQENFASIFSGNAEPVDLVQDGWTDIIRFVSPPTGGDGAAGDADKLQAAGFKKMELARRRIERTVVDRATANALKPYYHYFCKRPCFHDEYLEAFNRPNVKLVDTEGQGVARITPAGAVAGGREYQLDCLIYATGFDFLMEYTREAGLEVYGRLGVPLSEHWREGPRTLHAVMTDGFPNLFFLRLAQAGNSPNYTLTVDEQSKYIVDIIDQCRTSGGVTVEATAAAVNAWVDEVVEKAAPRQTFLETCTPGQYNYEGNPERKRFAVLNELYGGGAIAYFNILRVRRAGDVLSDLKMDPGRE